MRLTTELCIVVAAVSGPGGATLRLLDVHSGDLLTERHLHKPDPGRQSEDEALGMAIAFDQETDLYILSDAHTVRRVDDKTGEVKWEWSALDQR